MVRDHLGAPFATISSIDFSTYYRLPKKEEAFNTQWLSNFVIPTKEIFREWWQEPSKLWVRNDQVYRMEGIKKVYQLITAMTNLLYDKPDANASLKAWVPIMYVVATRGTIFNWANILALVLKTNIVVDKPRYCNKNAATPKATDFNY